MTAANAKKLGSVISVSKGKKHFVVDVPSPSSKRLLGIDDLRNDVLLRYTDDSSGTVALPQDVLIAWDGANAGTIGYGKSGYIGSTIARLRINEEEEIFTPFLGAFLKSKFDYLRQTATGATIPHINRKALNDIELPDVKFNDQIRIAHLLGKVEGLIVQRKQHLQQLDNLLKSVFLKMFGDPILNPHKFPVRRLAEFYVNPKEGTKCGPFGSALKKEELVDSGVPVWNMDNIAAGGQMALPFRMWITSKKYADLEAYSVQDGDIVISRAGTVGKMCVVRMNGQPAIISTNLIRLRLGDKLRPFYFVSLMLYCKGRVGRLKTGPDGSFTHMNTGVLDSLEFPYPSVELQDQFGKIASKVEIVKEQYRDSLSDLTALYEALSQKAFKGKLDLSRISLLSKNVVETNTMSLKPIFVDPNENAVYLPNIDKLLDLVHGPVRHEDILKYWLNAYINQLGETAFSLKLFMSAAQYETEKLYTDNDIELGTEVYDHIKTWVFEALDAGYLAQSQDITGFDKNGQPIAGNRMELKAAQA